MRRNTIYKTMTGIFVLTVVIYMIADASSSSLKKTAKYVYRISDACEGSNLYIVNHGPEENRKYVSSVAKKVSAEMVSLGKHSVKLPDQEPAKTPLLQFIEEWNEEQIAESLLNDSRFQSDLGYLKSLIPDKRKRWKTPFPIYRP